MVKDDLGLIVMENCKILGSEVNEELQRIRGNKKNYIIPSEAIRFNDGEGKVKILESVRGKDIYIISDVHNYSCTYEMYNLVHNMSPDEHYQDIKRVILALMGHAKSIKIVMPFLYASRQHKRKGRESLDCAFALQELEALGVNNIITFDVHDPNIQNAVPTVSFDNFYANSDILAAFIKKEKITDVEDTIVISPDVGAMSRAKYLADMLKVDVGMFYKRRDLSKIVNGSNPIVAHEYLGKDVKGKKAIIIDDMIASGSSVLEVAKELKERGCHQIFLFSTFSLFSRGIEIFENAYEEKLFTRLYTTNLTYVPAEYQQKEWFVMVNCSKYLAKIINALNNHDSIANIINETNELVVKISKKVIS